MLIADVHCYIATRREWKLAGLWHTLIIPGGVERGRMKRHRNRPPRLTTARSTSPRYRLMIPIPRTIARLIYKSNWEDRLRTYDSHGARREEHDGVTATDSNSSRDSASLKGEEETPGPRLPGRPCSRKTLLNANAAHHAARRTTSNRCRGFRERASHRARRRQSHRVVVPRKRVGSVGWKPPVNGKHGTLVASLSAARSRWEALSPDRRCSSGGMGSTAIQGDISGDATAIRFGLRTTGGPPAVNGNPRGKRGRAESEL